MISVLFAARCGEGSSELKIAGVKAWRIIEPVIWLYVQESLASDFKSDLRKCRLPFLQSESFWLSCCRCRS